VILLPTQKDSANPWRCWNWFDPRTSRGDGEAAIVAAQIRAGPGALSHRPQARVRRGHVVWRRSRGSARCALSAAGDRRRGAFGYRVRRRAVRHDGHRRHEARARAGSSRRSPRRPARRRCPTRYACRCWRSTATATKVVRPAHAAALVRQYLVLNGDDPARCA
jgi:hypothetical protein